MMLGDYNHTSLVMTTTKLQNEMSVLLNFLHGETLSTKVLVLRLKDNLCACLVKVGQNFMLENFS